YEFEEGIEHFNNNDPDYAEVVSQLKTLKTIQAGRFTEVPETLTEYNRLVLRREKRISENTNRHNTHICSNTVRDYVSWVKDTVLLVFRHTNSEGVKHSVKRAAKRGDRRYRKQVLQRMDPIFKACEDLPPFFNYKTRTVNAKSNCLYVTGTIPHDSGLEEAWREVMPYHFNLFMSRLRREYGKVWIVWRTWEAHKDGQPHFHAILMFSDIEFRCFRYKNKWRIPKRDEIRKFWGSKYDFKIGEYRGSGENGAFFNMDIQAMDSLGGGLSYVAKYITKATKFDGKSDD
ncbi:unnamed protein product, partial [marine sediment metagenome]